MEVLDQRRVAVKKILVVDHSAVQRKMIIQIIRKAGFTNDIMEAGDGLDAIVPFPQ